MRARYEIVRNEPWAITIRDVGHAETTSVTNDAEAVVEDLVRRGVLHNAKRLFYFDSDDNLDEILHAEGAFVGFAPWEREGTS